MFAGHQQKERHVQKDEAPTFPSAPASAQLIVNAVFSSDQLPQSGSRSWNGPPQPLSAVSQDFSQLKNRNLEMPGSQHGLYCHRCFSGQKSWFTEFDICLMRSSKVLLKSRKRVLHVFAIAEPCSKMECLSILRDVKNPNLYRRNTQNPCLDHDIYSLVNLYKTMEHHHAIDGKTHCK